MSKKHILWMSPCFVAAVLLSVYAAYGLFPFGTGTVSWCDMNQQVIPLLMDLKDILSGKADLFLNLQNAGGMSFVGVFFFFLASPFSFLVAFVGKAQFYTFVNILLLLKMMACSVSAGLFFLRRFPRLDLLQTVSLSVMYAFCGYAMLYFQNLVWLDVMGLFPLLLLSLGRLLRTRKTIAFVLALSAVLVVNFYLSYMVVIFLIFGLGRNAQQKIQAEDRADRAFLFCLSCAAAFLLTSAAWLPLFVQYLSSARTGSLIASLRTGGLLAKLATTIPVILCTGGIFAAVFISFGLGVRREPKIRWALWMLAAMLVPVFLEPVNKMWHTGSYQSFPTRYGYIPVFLGLIVFASVLSALNEDGGRISVSVASAVCCAGAIAAVLFCAQTLLKNDFEEITVYTRTLWGDTNSLHRLLLFALAAALTYAVLMLQYHYRRISRVLFSALLCMMTVIEAAFYANVYIASAKSNAQYYVPVMDLAGKISDESLYRVKMEQKYFDVNLVGGMGYGSLSHYTSLTSKDYMYAMKKLGYSSYWMEVNSNGGTKLTDALLGNEFTVRRTDSLGSEQPVYGNGLYSLVKSDDALPVGILFRPAGKIQSLSSLPDLPRLPLQQYLFQSVFHTDQNLFVPYEPSSLDNVALSRSDGTSISLKDPSREGTITYEIPVTGTQTLYFDCFDQLSNKLYEPINSSFSVTVNGTMLELQYPTQPDNGLVNLGTFTNRKVAVEIGVFRNVTAKSFGISGLNDRMLDTAVAGVTRAALRQSGNSIVGTATADRDGEYLLLPVDYAKGFSASVNGKKTDVARVFDTFLAVPMEKGLNDIRVTYVPDGFRTGLVLSCAGLLCLPLLSFLEKREGKSMRAAKRFCAAAFAVLCLFAFASIYVFPLVVFFTRRT